MANTTNELITIHDVYSKNGIGFDLIYVGSSVIEREYYGVSKARALKDFRKFIKCNHRAIDTIDCTL